MGLTLRELVKGDARGIVHLYPEHSLVRPPIKFSVEQREGNVVYGKVLPIGGKGHMEAVVKKMRGVEEPPLVPYLMPWNTIGVEKGGKGSVYVLQAREPHGFTRETDRAVAYVLARAQLLGLDAGDLYPGRNVLRRPVDLLVMPVDGGFGLWLQELSLYRDSYGKGVRRIVKHFNRYMTGPYLLDRDERRWRKELLKKLGDLDYPV